MLPLSGSFLILDNGTVVRMFELIGDKNLSSLKLESNITY